MCTRLARDPRRSIVASSRRKLIGIALLMGWTVSRCTTMRYKSLPPLFHGHKLALGVADPDVVVAWHFNSALGQAPSPLLGLGERSWVRPGRTEPELDTAERPGSIRSRY